MNLEIIIELAARAKADELITKIENGEISYDATMSGLAKGGTTS